MDREAEVKEIPIIFQPEIIRTILDGVCNLTFRVIKPQPSPIVSDEQYKKNIQILLNGGDRCCPYGQAGDRLWVRETWCQDWDMNGITKSIVYKASAHPSAGFTWRPSIHMPRWASRITLERSEPAYVKRTLDITEEEAKLCGFESDAVIVNTPAGKDYTGLFALDRYMAYWDLLNKARGFPFADNVWVWGVPFGAMSYRGK